MSAIIRAGYEGFLTLAPEDAILGANVKTLPAAPGPLTFVGYTDSPQIQVNDNTQGVETAGSYKDIAFYDGPRTVDYSANVTLSAHDLGGGAHFLHYALRNGPLSGAKYKRLPLVAVGAGALKRFDQDAQGSGYLHLGRFALFNQIGLQFAEGQPVMAQTSIMPICRQTGSFSSELSELDTVAEANEEFESQGSVLTWNDLDWTIGGVSYREYIMSAQISVNNNLQRRGVRPIYAASNAQSNGSADLSRCPYAIVPGLEKLQVQISTHDLLPPELMEARTLGIMNFTCGGFDPEGNYKTITIGVEHSKIDGYSQQGGQVSGAITYNLPFYSRGVSVTVN